MRYIAHIWREDGVTLAEFPDCPGCQTFAPAGQDIAAMAADALAGWLDAHLATGKVPPAPSARVRRRQGRDVLAVDVPPRLAVKVALRRARHDRHLTQQQLAGLAGVSQPAVAQLESPDSNPTLATLERVAEALGCRLDVSLVARPARPPPSPPARRTRARPHRAGAARCLA